MVGSSSLVPSVGHNLSAQHYSSRHKNKTILSWREPLNAPNQVTLKE